MKALIQRVSASLVCVGGEPVGAIGKGLNILLGVCREDDEADLEYLAQKIVNLRIFTDENGKMNQSLLEIGGEALVISQFTLCADYRRGRRPSFQPAADPAQAEAFYERFVQRLGELSVRRVQTGRFGADMQVSIENDGPVTLLLDSAVLREPRRG